MKHPNLSFHGADLAEPQIRQRRPTATAEELAAVQRLIAVARRDTGQSGRIANFLLAWWNATTCGGFDLTDLWCVDRDLKVDMLTVIGMIARLNEYPPALGFEQEFRDLLRARRPKLFGDADSGSDSERAW